jgi:hypothetical protein
MQGYGFSPMLNPVRRIQIPAYRKEQALALIEELAGSGEREGTEDSSSAE